MVRRSFRIGLRLGLLIGVGFALVKTVQSRRSPGAAPAPPAPWTPIVDDAPAADAPVEEPVDEVGEPIEEPASPPPAFAREVAPEPVDTGKSEGVVDVPGLDVPVAPVEPVEPVKKAAAKKAAGATKKAVKKAAKTAKTAKAAGAMVPPPAWVKAEGGVCPPTHPVKAKVASRLFHLPGMLAYDRTKADRCYVDAAAAEGEGFTKAKR